MDNLQAIQNIKGFNKLSKEQQEQLIRMNERHKAGVGNDYKEGWTPISVKGAGSTLKVTFKNGEWLHYYANGTWG